MQPTESVDLLVRQAIILIAIALAEPVETSIDLIDNDLFGRRRLVCSKGTHLRAAVLVFNFFYMVFGVIYSWRTRTLRVDQFGESGFVIPVLFLLALFAPGIALTLPLTGLARHVTSATFSGLAFFFTLFAIFLPKVYGVYADESFSGHTWQYLQSDDYRNSLRDCLGRVRSESFCMRADLLLNRLHDSALAKNCIFWMNSPFSRV
eukprot:m.198900 g.198900  ORF g.198900 m.198900 type:complete len:206 (+) comp10655_c0_seq9:1239-1856(+)